MSLCHTAAEEKKRNKTIIYFSQDGHQGVPGASWAYLGASRVAVNIQLLCIISDLHIKREHLFLSEFEAEEPV